MRMSTGWRRRSSQKLTRVRSIILIGSCLSQTRWLWNLQVSKISRLSTSGVVYLLVAITWGQRVRHLKRIPLVRDNSRASQHLPWLQSRNPLLSNSRSQNYSQLRTTGRRNHPLNSLNWISQQASPNHRNKKEILTHKSKFKRKNNQVKTLNDKSQMTVCSTISPIVNQLQSSLKMEIPRFSWVRCRRMWAVLNYIKNWRMQSSRSNHSVASLPTC